MTDGELDGSGVRESDDETAEWMATQEPESGRPTRWVLIAVPVVLLVLLTFVALRFVTASAAPEAATARATTLAERTLELEQRVAASADDVSAWQALGSNYTHRADESGDPSFYDLAGDAFDRADALDPDDPLTLVGRGHLALALHDFDGARALGLRAREQLPASGDVLAILVDAEVELGHYVAAVDWLGQLVEIRPDIAALARVSYLRELHGDRPGAVAAMVAAQAAGEGGSAFDQATVSALLGDLLLDGGDRAGARSAYEAALDASAGSVPAQIGMARIEALGGDLEAAIDRLDQIVNVQPRPDALKLLADLRRLVGDEPGAAEADDVIRAVAKLQEAAGQSVDLEMALFEADRGDDPQQAVELATRTHEARPDNIFAADVLGWALHRAGRSSEAVVHVEQAVRLGSRDPSIRFHAASIYAAVGDDERAREHLRMVADAGGWMPLGYRAEAASLARELDIAAPAAWTER